MSLQNGGIDEVRGEDPALGLPDEDEKQAEAERELDDEMHEVDVTSSTIHGGSLLDYETDELGGVASPHVNTDEQAATERRREAATEELESTLPSGVLHPRRPRRTAGAA
jgi:hypothetical protein